MKWVVRLVAAVGIAFAAAATALVVSMRTKSPAVLDRMRRFNRNVTNPRVLRTAGQPGANAGVIHHVGRVSGRSHQTPVGPFRVDGAYVIGLPYGPDTDWVRNVLASGTATLVHEGETVQVHEPEIVPASEVASSLPALERRTQRLFGVHHCLRLRPAG